MNEHLTTSRVHRLLRPLRNKCISLAALPTAARPIYSKQSSTWDRPPLSVLCPPAGVKKLMLDRLSADEFEISRRIYAVCDAFKNIVHVAYVQPCQRMPSLAAMCTLVIGDNMPFTSADGTMLDHVQDTTENEILDVDTIYESVPPHYRSSLIVSHALSVILSICTHHHTLVTILLDHCLSFGLVHESTRLLNIVLAQAFLPLNLSYPPPATHPAHTNFLLDLHAKWTAGSKPSSSGALQFTTSAFCQAVLDTFSQSSSPHNLWTSKVSNRLFHAVSSDLDSYIVITYTLSGSSWTSPDAIQDGVQPMMLRDKLSELMSNLFDLLFIHDNPHSPLHTSSRVYAAIDILHNCHAARFHSFRTSTPGSSVDLPDIIIIFATHIFVSFRNLIDNPSRLLAILDDSSPVPTTFSKLMLYFGRLRNSQVLGDFIKVFLAQLEMYSSALRSEKLFVLDASLWACALYHFETSIASSQKDSSALVTGFKQQLMEAVDAAERRCFGPTMNRSPVVSLPLSSRRTKRGRLSGHWEWEDMVGSWIRKTPVHKKRKTDDGRPHGHIRSRDALISEIAAGSISPSTPLSICCRRLSTHSPTSSFQCSEYDGSDYQEESDKENYPSSPPSIAKQSRAIRRRSSNFFSLLADAQTNRIVLHPKPCPKQKPPSSTIPKKHVPPLLSSQESQHIPRNSKQERQISHGRTSAVSRTLFSSDDALDLFTYATSSPAKPVE